MAKYKINSDSVAHFPIVIGQLFAEGFRQVAQLELAALAECDRLCWLEQSTRMSPSCSVEALVGALQLSLAGRLRASSIVRSHSKRPPPNCVFRWLHWPP